MYILSIYSRGGDAFPVRLSILASPKHRRRVVAQEEPMRIFREMTGTSSPRQRFEVQMSGPDVLHEPFLNKGDAFTSEERAM